VKINQSITQVMDDGGDEEAQAQPGPLSSNYDPPEVEPWTWIDTAMVYLVFAFSAVVVACGVVFIMVRPRLDPDGVPLVTHSACIVIGSIIIPLGFVVTALGVFLVKTELRPGREVNAMTHLHMVPLSRRCRQAL
jgi:hypothetical protein